MTLPPENIPAHMRGDRNQNPPDIGFFALIAEDYRTHESALFEQGFWAVSTHRFGNARMSIKPKILRAPFSLLYKMLYKWVEWTCGISLPYTVKLGRRVHLWHHGGMILHAHSIGDDVHIRQNTTFGVAKPGDLFQLPKIEDRCDIGCGAALLGAITIGHDSIIGANAVVIKNIPPHSIAVGIPARVVRTNNPLAFTTPPETTSPTAPLRPLLNPDDSSPPDTPSVLPTSSEISTTKPENKTPKSEPLSPTLPRTFFEIPTPPPEIPPDEPPPIPNTPALRPSAPKDSTVA